MKLNVDGSFSQATKQYWFKWLTSLRHGLLGCGFHQFWWPWWCPLGWAFSSETWPRCCLGLGSETLLCEMDSLKVATLLQKPDMNHFHAFASVVGEVVALLKKPWSVQVHHIYREANVCVYFLAENGAPSQQPNKILRDPFLKDVIWLGPPVLFLWLFFLLSFLFLSLPRKISYPNTVIMKY